MIRSARECGVSYRREVRAEGTMYRLRQYLRDFCWIAGVVGTIGSPALRAQFAPPPSSYSVTVVNSMFGPPVTMKIYRDGDLVLMDHPDHHIRGLYNLKTHSNQGWDSENPESGCSSGTFSGDWGDPFTISDLDDLLKSSTQAPASDTINGVATKVYEATDPQSKIHVKVWREPKYGMVIKAEMTPPGAATTTIIEIKQFSFTKPAASLFTLPAACANAPPPPPTASERFTKDTGENAANFEDATMGPGSANSCTMLLRFVKAGAMQPINGFRVGLDRQYDVQHPPHYTIGSSVPGGPLFSGGHLTEYTAQIKNGVLRIDNVPSVFDIEMSFGDGSRGATAILYRKCSSPQTVLLYVDQPEPGQQSDWLWVKSGKFATVAAH